STTVGRPRGSVAVVTTPTGLFSRKWTSPGRTPTGTPSTSTESAFRSMRRPRWARSPLTRTLPSTMSSTQARRLPKPRLANIFCRRSPLAVVGSASRAGFGAPKPASAIPGRAQSLLQRLDHLRAGNEVAQRRQLLEAVEPQPLEEQRGRPVQHGLAGAGISCHPLDVPPLGQRPDHAVHVDAPDRRHLGPGDRLLVGHDGKGLQGGSREAGRLTFEHEALDVVLLVRMALEPIAAGHPGQ